MLAKDLISDIITSLEPSDTGSKALHSMEIFKVSHLAVVDQGNFIGLISDTDILDYNSIDAPISKYPFPRSGPFVTEYQHLYEVIELVLRLDITAIPVLNEQRKYMGTINLRHIVHAFGDMASVRLPGGILVLELNANDYSLAQISRIVEDNNAKLLCCHITSPIDSVLMEVTLKINQIDLTSVIQTFLRYEYTIKATYQSKNQNEEILRNNYDQFMMYLNV